MIISRNNPDVLKIVSSCLLEKKTVIMACDTIYGIHGVAPDTKESIIRIKGRDEHKPFVLLCNEEMIADISSKPVPEFIWKYWPGPLTVIVRTEENQTAAIRFPDDPFIINVLKATKIPLYSTSVNFSGKPAINDIERIKMHFSGKVDLICDSGNLESGLPSTILDISTSPYRILRPGRCLISEKYLQ